MRAGVSQSMRWTLLFAAFVTCWVTFFFLHPTALSKIGIAHFRVEVAPDDLKEIWFLDTYAVLAANDAVRRGADPYAPNPLDYLQRPHVYGPAWLYLHHLGLGRADQFEVGLALSVAFLLAVIVTLRPDSAGKTAWCILICCTTPLLSGIERGNNDLVIFLLLMPLVPCVLSTHPTLRWLPIPLIAFAMALKYYPAVAAVVLLANASTREVRARIVVTTVAFAAVAWHLFVTVPDLVRLVPAPRGVLTFGAVNGFLELGATGRWPAFLTWALAALAIVFWWRSPVFRDWQVPQAQQGAWLHFVLGAALLTGCFFLGQSYAYRWIFALWLAPFLWYLMWDAAVPSSIRKLGRFTAGLLLVMLWAECLVILFIHRQPDATLLRSLDLLTRVMQPFTWVFFLGLLGFLTAFVRNAVPVVMPQTRHFLSGTIQ